MHFHIWGFELGKLSVCWFDLWERKWGLEVVWGNTLLVDRGFKTWTTNRQ